MIWETISTFLGKQLINFILSKIVDGTKKNLSSIKRIFTGKLRYFSDLEEVTRNMPFIYKDIDAEVLEDFVNLDVRTISSKDLVLLAPYIPDDDGTQQPNNVSSEFAIQTKLLLLGNPGMGKSTLMRYTVMSILKRRSNIYLKRVKHLIPIFIPLKAIGNVKKSPIISYILEDISLFKGKTGRKRLLKLLKEKRIFLMLDGYDELNMSTLHEFAQYEINLFLTDRLSPFHLDKNIINFDYIEIYTSLSICRVWVSTREEFYRLNPLKNLEYPSLQSIYNPYDRYFTSLRILGLSDSRLEFIRNIFNRYKAKASFFNERLDAEFFLNAIDSSADDELILLSKTPLFLTIMCYIYVEEIRASGKITESWKLDISNLVTKCTETLLVDLDEYKVRNHLTEKQRKFYKKVATDFPEEKMRFLRYFSYMLILESIPVFTVEYLTEKVYQYFSKQGTSVNNVLIIDQLKLSKAKHSNIVIQLINSGLFTTVNIVSNRLHYDFPHRRFRETLAAAYVDNVGVLEHILSEIRNRNLSEFIVLIFQLKPGFRSQIANACLNTCASRDDYNYCNKLLYNCVINSKDYEVMNLLEDKIKIWVADNTSVRVLNKLGNIFLFRKSFLDWLYIKASREDDSSLNSINLALSCLLWADATGYKEKLVAILLNINGERLTFFDFLVAKYYFLTHRQNIKQTEIIYGDVKMIHDELLKNGSLRVDMQTFSTLEKKTILLQRSLRDLLKQKQIAALMNDLPFIFSMFAYEVVTLLSENELVDSLEPLKLLEIVTKPEILILLPEWRIETLNIDKEQKYMLVYRKIKLLLKVDKIEFDILPDFLKLNIYLAYFSVYNLSLVHSGDSFFKIIKTELIRGNYFVISYIKRINPIVLNRLCLIDRRFGQIVQLLEKLKIRYNLGQITKAIVEAEILNNIESEERDFRNDTMDKEDKVYSSWQWSTFIRNMQEHEYLSFLTEIMDWENKPADFLEDPICEE